MTAAFDPLRDCPTLGEAFRQGRLASGRTLEQLSTVTKVPARYLTALEYGDYGLLPSRVFAVGYVRAYAQALGLDDAVAAQRFRREAPDASAPLQAPTGVAHEEVHSRTPLILGVAAAAVIAVIGWNIFQRVVRIAPPHPSEIAKVPDSWAKTPALTDGSAEMELGAPSPAPQDQTVPEMYITPGLEAQLAGIDPEDAEAMAALAAAGAPPVQAAFNPRGPIYGAEAAVSDVVIQAVRPSVLVVRIGEGRVLFARQLAEGESWRAPRGVAATVDVNTPDAFAVYLNGEYAGPLAGPLTPLAQLNARAQSTAQQAAAVQAARTEALRAEAVRAEAARAAALQRAAPPATAPIPMPGPAPAPAPAPARAAPPVA